jgi:hypothetical protein
LALAKAPVTKNDAGTPCARRVVRIDAAPWLPAPPSKVSATTRRVVGTVVRTLPRSAAGSDVADVGRGVLVVGVLVEGLGCKLVDGAGRGVLGVTVGGPVGEVGVTGAVAWPDVDVAAPGGVVVGPVPSEEGPLQAANASNPTSTGADHQLLTIPCWLAPAWRSRGQGPRRRWAA